eukprot:g27260.t1
MEYSEALFIVASDFNQANLKNVFPKYHQHVSCPSRGPTTLDHRYTTIKDTYRSIPCLQFGKSDHNVVLFLPAHKQKLKREDLDLSAQLGTPSGPVAFHGFSLLKDGLTPVMVTVGI